MSIKAKGHSIFYFPIPFERFSFLGWIFMGVKAFEIF